MGDLDASRRPGNSGVGLLAATFFLRPSPHLADLSIFSAIISLAPMVIYTYYFAIRLFKESVPVTVIKQTVLTVLFVVLVVSLVIGDAVIRSAFTRN